MWLRQWSKAGLISLCLGFAVTASASFELVSRIDGEPPLANGPNKGAVSPSLSADGRYVAFASASSNLVAEDNNGRVDIFVFDRVTDSTEVLTMGGSGASFDPSISADGRFVAFSSTDDELVIDDPNGNRGDIFVIDRETGTTELLTPGGNERSLSPSISADGRFVAFASKASNLEVPESNVSRNFSNIFVYDRNTDTTERLTTATDFSRVSPSISADGRYVAFGSNGFNLITGRNDGPNEIFLHDRVAGTTDVLASGSFNPSINADGRFVVYGSSDGIQIYDRDTSSTDRLISGVEEDGLSVDPAISANGQLVAFRSTSSNLVVDDTNGVEDVFLYNRETEILERVTEGANDVSRNVAISSDGQFVSFATTASNLVPEDTNNAIDVLVYDREVGGLTRIPPTVPFEVAGGNGESIGASVNEDGRFVAFESLASDLVDEDSNEHSDIFVYDRNTANNELLTRDANAGSFEPSISATGRFVAFQSDASNLVAGDQNGRTDIFVYDRDTASTQRLTPGGNHDSESPSISADGRFVAFESRADNLVAGDTNGANADILLYDRDSDTTSLVTAGGDSLSIQPSISANGRFVAFSSIARNLVVDDPGNALADIFVYDRVTGTIELLTSGANDPSTEPAISEDGDFVAFVSNASNLGVGASNISGNNVYLYDRLGSTIELLTPDADFGGSTFPSISADGRFVVFSSRANNLLPGDINGQDDVFVYDQTTSTLRQLTQDTDGASRAPSISSDGLVIAFSSKALNLANDGTNSSSDVFVTATNNQPIADALITSTNEDTPLSVTVTGFDQDADALTFEVVEQPTNGKLTGTGPNFVYTPNADFFGVDSFTYRVSDGIDSSLPASVSITVRAVNDAPLGVGVTGFSTPEDTAISVTLMGSDVDGDPLTYVVTNEPVNGTVSGAAPNLFYTPNADFNGLDTFTYTVSDGTVSSSPVTLSFTVLAINDGPVAVSQSLATPAATPLAITLAGSDVDSEPLSFVIISLPANGSLTGAVPNVIYTPADNFSGTDSFSFTVSDDAATSAVATVLVAVATPVVVDPDPETENSTPVADALTISTLRETPVSITLTASDADSDALTFNFVSAPDNGSLSGGLPDLLYTPDTGFVGADSFAFTVSDGQATSAPVSVSITVIDGTVTLFSAVLPASRSVEVGATATAFATLSNAGSAVAQGCSLRLPDAVTAAFFYQTSDPATNAVVGQPNLTVDIPAGGAQSFVFGITPGEELSAVEVALRFQCANAIDAASVVGLNTLLLSSSLTPVPDLIALVATTTASGVMELENDSGFFTAATINIGSAATVTVTADTADATLPLTLTLCQTDPQTSVCINPSLPSTEPVVVAVEQGATPTFAVFATAAETIAPDPANSRVFLRFSDESGEVRGATSVAVQSSQ